MDFKRARTQGQIDTRRDEILNACTRLYVEKGYDGVNFKAVSELTSVSRPSLYKYYSTKGEMLLEILRRCYSDWADELGDAFASAESLDRETFCGILTDSLMGREMMLKLLSLDLIAIENDSEVGRITDFKTTVRRLMETIDGSVRRFFPDADRQSRDMFISSFFAYMYGIYPMTHPTEKLVEAMEAAGIVIKMDMREICYGGFMLLTSDL